MYEVTRLCYNLNIIEYVHSNISIGKEDKEVPIQRDTGPARDIFKVKVLN